MRIPVVLSWSGGKDSAFALNRLTSDDRFEVVGLLTTFTKEFNRVSMHGVRRELILSQADSIGIPLEETWIDKGAGNEDYELVMLEALAQLKSRNISTIAFGDLFLEDIRNYREQLIERSEMEPIFPVWGENTSELAMEFVEQGYEAITCCVDSHQIHTNCCGQLLDHDFFMNLPDSADPCGENGEFHSFVTNSPEMSVSIPVQTGPQHIDGQFVFTDIQLKNP